MKSTTRIARLAGAASLALFAWSCALDTGDPFGDALAIAAAPSHEEAMIILLSGDDSLGWIDLDGPQEFQCSDFDGTNEALCEIAPHGLRCEWDEDAECCTPAPPPPPPCQGCCTCAPPPPPPPPPCGNGCNPPEPPPPPPCPCRGG